MAVKELTITSVAIWSVTSLTSWLPRIILWLASDQSLMKTMQDSPPPTQVRSDYRSSLWPSTDGTRWHVWIRMRELLSWEAILYLARLIPSFLLDSILYPPSHQHIFFYFRYFLRDASYNSTKVLTLPKQPKKEICVIIDYVGRVQSNQRL